MNSIWPRYCGFLFGLAAAGATASIAAVGVGTKPPAGAEMLFDGTREMLDAKWTYWKGPRAAAELPIKWPLVPDPVSGGTVLSTDDPAVPS